MRESRKRWEKVYKRLLEQPQNEDLIDSLIAIESSMVGRLLKDKGIHKPTKQQISSTHEELKKTLKI